MNKEANMTRFNLGAGNVTAVFDYVAAARELILRAKTRNDASALGLLLQACEVKVSLWMEERAGDGLLVVPAPSSLWGRMKGRFDIALMASEHWFRSDQIVRAMLPGTFFRKKRAGINQSLNSNASLAFYERFFIKKSNFINKISMSRHIVVVDDVMTTGFTMKATIELLKSLGAQTVEGLVIASSNKDLASDEY
jgi:predicted amidophosphoribosyltransferase